MRSYERVKVLFKTPIIMISDYSSSPPPQLQVKACGLTPSFAADEVQFLRALCLRLARDPGLADFFIMVRDLLAVSLACRPTLCVTAVNNGHVGTRFSVRYREVSEVGYCISTIGK